MVYKTDEFIKNRILWKVSGCGLSKEFAWQYDDLTATHRKDLEAYIPGEAGLPVLLFTRPGKEWTLLCTRLMVGFGNDESFFIRFSELGELTPILKTEEGYLIPNEVQDQMAVTNVAGSKWMFRTSQGADFYTLWNILLMMRGLYSASWKINLPT